MPVYVDEPIWRSRGRRWCHLTADTTAELHTFADALGLRRAWFQSRPGQPWKDHYDLPDYARARAVERGALLISRREAGARLIAARRAADQASRSSARSRVNAGPSAS